ncbi:DUF2628 domain-containing protein [Sporolactobacillus sp. CPB3-1]|uniref:DUF2628 domain-containing protein n=1 Tax=Sporolactobacillus mangiferae TaxID=2940498 RepID=A0ABT0M9V2_9BACL|nr:DUF2628 domain-containing protein [Sporolactobacillus mangiferae]MCL1631651.1 DUF2628 domain-containing protein [Sporolactobacillus mangiferae]
MREESTITEWKTRFSELSDETKEELLIYVGKNSDVYERRWEQMDERKSLISWNWPSFFFFSYWAVHRKMYLWAYGYLILSNILDYALNDVPLGLYICIFLPLSIISGLFGNQLYFLTALNALQKLKARIPDRIDRLDHLQSFPGYSWPAFWICFFIDIAVSMIFSYA